MIEMIEKIFHWLIFSLFLSLFPIVLTGMLLGLINKNCDLLALIGNGELYIVTASLIAPFFGDLLLPIFKTKSNLNSIWRLIIIGALLIQLMASVGLYSGTIITQSLNIGYNINRIVSNSIVLFISSCSSIIASIVFKENAKEDIKNGN